MRRLQTILAHPLTRGIDVDDPRLTALRRRIVREKVFLREIYLDWYRRIARALPPPPGRVLELGSGAGFFSEVVPEAIMSEVFCTPGIDVVLDGLRLPLADRSLRAIVMTDVMHHLPDARQFFVEATRCVRPGGVIAMIEPWVTPWSTLIYRRLHHEPFDTGAGWSLPKGGPLSSANGALPWIVFRRDARQFASEFPRWRIEQIHEMMPLRYLLSGGVSMRSLLPRWSSALWRGVEAMLAPARRQTGMFAFIVLRRLDDD
jgi:SAM-dependent methyltransferase